MFRHFATNTLYAGIALAVVASGFAHAAALVGVTTLVAREATPPPTPDRLKAEYRRPEEIPFPPRNPYTPEKAMLGRMLFYDTRLSGAGALSCASCHNPAFGHGDGLGKGIGAGMQTLNRRSPSLVNNAWGQIFMWDGRTASLEEQAIGPIQSPVEMNQPVDRLINTLDKIPGYNSLFATVFPHREMSPSTIADAIATYERTIVSARAPFDAWIEGNEAAIPDAARRGFVLFNTKARCASCHGGWLFTDEGFHDIGLPDVDTGRGRLFPLVDKMKHAFKTPSLRETTLRGPYMHDGSLPTLEGVIAHYNQGGVKRSSRSDLIEPLGLSPGEQEDIVAFLNTLSGPITSNVIPALPR